MVDEFLEIEGLTNHMLVSLGENDIKTIEDLAGCATDDLVGWDEEVDGETKHMEGALEKFQIDTEEANALIMYARLKEGWITEEDLHETEEEGEDGQTSEGEA